ADRGLAPRAGTFDPDLDPLHSQVTGVARARLGGNRRRERRALARPLEASLARARPGHDVAVGVGDRHDGVVERRLHVRYAIRAHATVALPGLLRFSHSLPPSGSLGDPSADVLLLQRRLAAVGLFMTPAVFLGPLRVRAFVLVR